MHDIVIMVSDGSGCELPLQLRPYVLQCIGESSLTKGTNFGHAKWCDRDMDLKSLINAFAG